MSFDVESYTRRLKEDELCIFLFHGVIRHQMWQLRNYTRKHLLAEEFEELISALNVEGEALSMDEVVAIQSAGRPWPSKGYVISFDDGFANNAEVAAPILEAHSSPAIFYITSDFIELQTRSWIDENEACFEAVGKVEVQLPWRENVATAQDASQKRTILDEIRFEVKKDPHLNIETWTRDLVAQCGSPDLSDVENELDKKMSWEQLSPLNEGLFRIGGHTKTHAILSHCSPQQLEEEVGGCMSALENKAGIKTEHFSYPEGLSHCYDEGVKEVLRDHGISCCPTAIDGTNPVGRDLFELHRIPVL